MQEFHRDEAISVPGQFMVGVSKGAINMLMSRVSDRAGGTKVENMAPGLNELLLWHGTSRQASPYRSDA